MFLSKELGRNYKMVLRRSGLDDPALERIIEDARGNTEEVIYKGFLQILNDPNICCKEKVIKALEDSRCKALADRIRNGEHMS